MDILKKQMHAYRLCELHFEEKCFSKAAKARKRLHADSVPTIFTNNPQKYLKVDSDNREIEEVPKKVQILSSKLFLMLGD